MITIYVEYEHYDEFNTAKEVSHKIKERLVQSGHVDDIEIITTDMEGN